MDSPVTIKVISLKALSLCAKGQGFTILTELRKIRWSGEGEDYRYNCDQEDEVLRGKYNFPELPAYDVELEITSGEFSRRENLPISPYMQGTIVAYDDKGYTLQGDWFGETFSLTLPWFNETFMYDCKSPAKTIKVQFEAETLATHLFATCDVSGDARLFYYAKKVQAVPLDLKGIAKEAGIFKQVADLDPIAGTLLQGLTSSKSNERIIRNKLLKVFFQAMSSDPAKIALEIRKACDQRGKLELNAVAKRLPGASTQLEVEEEKRDWTKRKEASSRAEGLGINVTNYPLLYAAICDENIPTGVFNHPTVGGQLGQPVNREFDVWEQALAQDCQETLDQFEALYPQLKDGRTNGLLRNLSVVKGSQKGWATLSFIRDGTAAQLILILKKTESRVLLGVISSAGEPFKQAFQVKEDHDPFGQYVDLKDISIRVTDYYPSMPARGWVLVSPNCYLDLRHQFHKNNLRSALESDLSEQD